jgi:quinol monooxygenase YgiN
MYGTVAHFRLKPGKEGQLLAIFREIEALKLPGALAAHGYRMDASAQDYYLAVVFTSREAYFAHAEHPEVVAIDRRLLELLESEPEWHDGEIVYALK